MKMIFKNFFVFVFVLLACIACQKEKDGVYRPDKRISQITTNYYVNHGDVPLESLTDIWHWNKKKLSKINYADGSVLTFEYKNRRLVSMILTGNEETARGELVYENKELKKVVFDYSNGGELVILMKKRVNGNVVQLQYDYQGGGGKGNFFEKSTTRMLTHLTGFPCDQPIARYLQSCAGNGNAAKGSYHWESTLTYGGGNVTRIHTRYGGVSTLNETTVSYEYDQHNNPFHRSIMDEFDGVLSYSTNNIVYCKSINYGVDTQWKWTYEYSDGWPVKRTYHGEVVEEVVYKY